MSCAIEQVAFSDDVLRSEWSILLEDVQNRGVPDYFPDSNVKCAGKLARYHGVLPFVNRDELEDFRRRNQMKALTNLQHLIRLLEVFSDKEVPVMVVKGIPLAIRLYGDVGARHAGDIDLWIPEEKMEFVHELLLEFGHTGKTGYSELSPYYQRLYRKRKFHVGYTHGDSGVSVEIHWRLGGTRQLFPVSFEEAYERRLGVSIGPAIVPTLDDTDHLLFLHCHAARHLWERLFWLVDLVDFHQIPGAPTPARLLERAREFGIERAVMVSWTLAGEFLNFSSGQKLCEKNRSVDKLVVMGRDHLQSFQEPVGPFRGMISAMMLHKSVSHKLQVLLEHLTASDDWYRVKLPSGCGWGYIFIRPWFLFQRKIRARDISK